jgi:Putative adhesin
MATWDFACSEPIDANVSLASGTVAVTAEPTDAITVQVHHGRPRGPARDDADDDQVRKDVTVEFADRHLVVSELPKPGLGWRAKALHITISMPAGSRSAVQAASAEVTCRGEYSAVDISTASGRVDVATVHGPAEISTMSGGVQVIEAAELNAQTASGRIAVRHSTGNVTARTASGDIRIGAADASVTARTASGRVLVAGLARGRADLNSVSGDIEVKVVPGTGVFLDLASVTGRVTSDLAASGQDDGADLHLQCRTVSGAVHVARAASAELARCSR